jgi:peptidylprolyl isomerase
MQQAKVGDRVKVHYTGFLEDGTLFDSSTDREPLTFTIGERELIPGFEDAVVGMNVGETKTITIPPHEAFGDYRQELVLVIQRSQIPSHIDPRLGMMLEVQSPEGTVANVTITEMNDETITLDGNHPLAGKTLTFKIELLEIV